MFDKLKFRSYLSFFTLILLIFGVGFGGWFVMQEIQQVHIVEEDIFPIIIPIMVVISKMNQLKF